MIHPDDPRERDEFEPYWPVDDDQPTDTEEE